MQCWAAPQEARGRPVLQASVAPSGWPTFSTASNGMMPNSSGPVHGRAVVIRSHLESIIIQRGVYGVQSANIIAVPSHIRNIVAQCHCCRIAHACAGTAIVLNLSQSHAVGCRGGVARPSNNQLQFPWKVLKSRGCWSCEPACSRVWPADTACGCTQCPEAASAAKGFICNAQHHCTLSVQM